MTEKLAGAFYDKGGAVAHSDHPDFGAKGDGRGVTDAAVASGSPTLTSATAAFTTADSGKAISVNNAGTPVAGTGTLTAAAGVGTFSADQRGVLGEGSGVIVGGVLYFCTAWLGTTATPMTVCTLSGSPTFGASAFNVGKTLLTTLTYVNATTVTLAANAGQTVSAATAHLGTDNTVALQAAIDACSASNAVHGTVPFLQLGVGQYKITGKLRFKSYRVAMRGHAMDQSSIHYEGVSAGGLVPDVITGANINIEDLSIYGDASSGHAIDLGSVGVDNTYLSTFRRLRITAGKNAIWSPLLFSASIEDVRGDSFLEHIFRVRCGPGLSWTNVYAGSCPVGKAGYRVTGTFRPRSCNGLNSGGYWVIGGSNTGATDGYQNDFPGLTTDYVEIILDSCNVEAWGVTALYAVQSTIAFIMDGGTISRTLATNYHSFARTAIGALASGAAAFRTRGGVRKIITGGTATASDLYSDTRGIAVLEDDVTAFTGMFSALDSVLYPAITVTTSRATGAASTQTFRFFSGVAGARVRPTVLQPVSATATYGASITVDGAAQSMLTIVPSNGTAFSILNPTNAYPDQILTVKIKNTFGVLGAVTWGTNYAMSAWTQPANGFSRSITFWHDGTKYIEISRTPADVPN